MFIPNSIRNFLTNVVLSLLVPPLANLFLTVKFTCIVLEKKNLIFKNSIVFLLLILSQPFLGQQYNFHNYSVKDGVAQSQVYSLLQDSRGYLWLGTRGGGITRYDGIEFKTFTVKDGLTNNYIFSIQEDLNHNLWIGTNNGVSVYNGITFKKINLKTINDQVTIYGISIDKKNRKWLATNMGVVMIDEKGIHYVTDELNYRKISVLSIFADNDGVIWFGSSEGLGKISEINSQFSLKKFTKEDGFNNNSVTCISQDLNGTIWIGTYGDGAYLFNHKKFYRIDLKQELYKQTVLNFCMDNDNVWLTTLNSGVAQYNTRTKLFTWLTEQEGLSNNHVRCAIKDKSGNYWFGTSGGGICNYFGKQFTVFDKSSGMAGNFVYSVFRDNNKRLWIGTADKGISLYDSSKFYNYNATNGFINAKIKAIAQSKDGTLYFGADGEGLFSYNGFEFKKVEGLDKKYIRAMTTDENENLWVATAGSGIYKLTFNNEKINLINYTVKDGLLSNRITCLLQDNKHGLWYGTETEGIGRIIKNRLLDKSFTKREGLPSNNIKCLENDNNGNLWVGTAGEGLACIELNNELKIKNYNHTKGLTSSNIYLISKDNNGNILAGSETGLDHLFLDKESTIKEIKHYGKGEGFTGIETCQNAVFKDEDGSIWFGTINGLIKYNPANTVLNLNEPITSITNVKLFYEPISNTSYKNFIGDWNKVSNLNLPYNQNHLTFDFISINFSNPYAVKYQWMLEGFDKDWSPVSTQHTFSYPNLSYGNYVFKVKACNEDGVWNKNPATIKFYIAPPYWLRWWFILLVALASIALVIFIFKWRVNLVKSKAAEAQKKTLLEKEVLELEQKALRLQMNPHFIFNALNSIQSQIGTDNEQKARYYLAKFSRLMRQILDNSRQSSITLEEEINTLENYLLIEKFCNGDRFDYQITVDNKIEKDYIKVPPMLLQPFIENAIKHGLKYDNKKRGCIHISFMEENDVLECVVLDNGIGRKKASELNEKSKETYHQSTALIVTQERLDLMQSSAFTNSLEIVDLYDEENHATGTKVIIRIPLG